MNGGTRTDGILNSRKMRSVGPLIRFVRHGQMLDDAPWEWGSTGGWAAGMPEFFQNMPGGVYDNIYEDLDDTPADWHITEVRAHCLSVVRCFLRTDLI